MSEDWNLGIDFGTSFTVAAVATAGASRVISIESDGSDRMPSAVFRTEDGEILVGRAAQHQAVFAPERFEPTPKRSLGEGELFLGDDVVPVAELAAAVLRRAYTEACRQMGERLPTELRVTYPADWAQARRAVLLDACQRAGMPEVQLVAEPVAAAVRIALRDTQPGSHIAVYDFGGGTFDAAVLARTEEGFQVAGPPVGRDPLGGEDIDRRIIAYVGGLLAEAHPQEWANLLDPPDVSWRRSAGELRAQVQQAKETLSEVAACQLWVPGIERELQLTRAELEDLIGDDIDETADAMAQALTEAGLVANDLAGLYLVGGSSRIPLVADTLWRKLGVRPTVQDNPKSIVAMGAAVWTTPLAAAAAARAPAAVHSAAVAFVPRLAMTQDPAAWPQGYRLQARLVVAHPADARLTVHARNDPADGDTAALAQAVLGARRARTRDFAELSSGAATVAGVAGGIERRFTMTADGEQRETLEQYLVVDGRAFVLAFPAGAQELAASVELGAAAGDGTFSARLGLSVAAGWSVTERLLLTRLGSGHAVSAERVVFAAAGDDVAWHQAHRDRLRNLPRATLVSRTPTRVLDAAAGEIMTVSWRREEQAGPPTPMITRLGIGVAGGEGLSLQITLPHAEQAHFAALAAHPVLRGA